MNYDNTSSLRSPMSDLDAARLETPNDAARATPWEPRGAKASRVLIGVLGAALVGGLAIGGVMLTPSKQLARPVAGDEVATAPQSEQAPSQQAPQSQDSAPQVPALTADQMAAQSQREPAAAGTAAATTTPETTQPQPAQASPATTDSPPSPAPKSGSDQ